MKAPRLLILASVKTTFFVAFTGTATANRGNDAGTVRLIDDCDRGRSTQRSAKTRASGTATRPSRSSVRRLRKAETNTGATTPKQTAVRQGHGLHLVNHGGEFHTFTKVDSFADGAASIAQDIARRLARALMAYRDTGKGNRAVASAATDPAVHGWLCRRAASAQILVVPQRTNAPRHVYSRCKQ